MAQLNLSNTESSAILIETFKTARKLLKKPVDYTNLHEVHSRCKIIMEKLCSTLEAIEHVDTTHQTSNKEPVIDHISKSKTSSENKLTHENRRKSKRKHTTVGKHIAHQYTSGEKSVKPVFKPSVIKKRKIHTFESFKDPLDLIKELTVESEIKSEEVQSSEMVVNSANSCEALAKAFSPLTATNTWELIQLRKMMEDPFLSATRKQFLPKRILELNENIIQDLMSQAESSEQTEFFLLDKLHTLGNNESLSPEQKQQVECVLTALKDKVVNDVLQDVNDSESNYDKTIDKLHSLLKIPWIAPSDKQIFIQKVMEIRGKMASGLAKQTHVPIEDGVRLLQKFRLVMKDPFLSRDSKIKLMQKVKYLRNTTVATLTKDALEEDNSDLIAKLNSMLQDPYLPYQKRISVVEKIKEVEGKASKELKNTKMELKEKIMTSLDEILGFEGTNLEFVVGYGIQHPNYVRCIRIWNPEKT